MKIALLCSSLGAGGAEKSALVLAEEFARRGIETNIVTCSTKIPDFYTVPKVLPRIRINLGKWESVRWFDVIGNIRRLYRIRRALKELEPDIIISFLDGLNELFLLATLGWSIKKIVSCQIDIRHHMVSSTRWRFLRKFTYVLADKIVFLDKKQADWCNKHFSGWTCTGIPNPVSIKVEKQENNIFKSPYPKNIIAMGRLAHQKGFDLLLQSFSQISGDFLDWGLIILGEGVLRRELEDQVIQLGLGDRVFLPGSFSNPFQILRTANIFAFSSRYEGQGMALIEAMSCGLPAVSFDCPSGPSEIIQNGVDGFLCPQSDLQEFSRQLRKLMENEQLRMEMGQKAKHVIERYSAQSIGEQWMDLFCSLTKKKFYT